jgi:vacuolar-type H+-ATPase subunit H
MKKAARPYVKKAQRAAEDLMDQAREKGREIAKDALKAGSKQLKKASKAL